MMDWPDILIRIGAAVLVGGDETTDLAVLDIGYACGFGGTSSFYESFKKLYDCSPTRYRSLYGRAK